MLQLQRLCIGFTSFRQETLSFAERMMQAYEAILLEEPQTPGFDEMLRCELPVEEYLQLTDFEFPEYASQTCLILQRLARQGKTILQVDPYMDELVRIHEFFAAEGRPDQIAAGTMTREVYDCERVWTGRLLTFYRASGSRQFERIVSSVKEFAKVDAQKGLLRNRMRAEAIAGLFERFRTIYVEAGYIHIPLMYELLRRLPAGVDFVPAYLMEPIVRSFTGRRQVFGPGDLLTMMYSFQSSFDEARADLLAAQSLIYNKVVHKEEMIDESGAYPHTRDEIEAIGLATSLDFEQCRKLFYALKPLETSKARTYAHHWRSQHLS
jgi:hypothetical protein